MSTWTPALLAAVAVIALSVAPASADVLDANMLNLAARIGGAAPGLPHPTAGSGLATLAAAGLFHLIRKRHRG